MYRAINCVNAETMARENPGTFEIPYPEEIETAKFVKICLIGVSPTGEETERVWIKVDMMNGNQLFGTINNVPLYSEFHKLYLGDPVQFSTNKVYQVYQT